MNLSVPLPRSPPIKSNPSPSLFPLHNSNHNTPVDIDNTPNHPVAKLDEADWSVVHNHEVTQTVNVRLAHTLKMRSMVNRVKFSREGKYLAVGLHTGETYIYDLKTLSNRFIPLRTFLSGIPADSSIRILTILERPPKEKPSTWAVQFSPDNKYVATGGSDGRITVYLFAFSYNIPSNPLPFKVWNIAKKRVFARFGGNNEIACLSVDFSPNGRFLVLGSTVWCMRDGSSKKFLDDKMSFITAMAISPDGRYVTAADHDGMLRIWNFRTRQLLGRWKPKGPAQPLWSVVFTSDGEGLLSGGEDETLRSWNVDSLMVNQLGSRRGAIDEDNVDEEKELLVFRGHTVCN
jgi:WD40 repeat protein